MSAVINTDGLHKWQMNTNLTYGIPLQVYTIAEWEEELRLKVSLL
jgi:hypothetical protein